MSDLKFGVTERKPDLGRLGGGLIAGAVGLSPYCTPLQAWSRITGNNADESPHSEDIDRGLYLEPALRTWAMSKLRAVATIQPGTLKHPSIPWASYTPDGLLVYSEEKAIEVGAEAKGLAKLGYEDADLLEIKSPGLWRASAWGDEGTDQVPRETLIQGVWGIMVTGAPRCRFAALINGRLKLFVHERDVELEQMVFEKASHFWTRYVLENVPPPPTFAAADTEWVKRRWPTSESPHLKWSELTPGQRATVAHYLDIYAKESHLEEALAEAGNHLRMMLADAGGLALDDVDAWPGVKRIDYKSNKPSVRVDHAACVVELARRINLVRTALGMGHQEPSDPPMDPLTRMVEDVLGDPGRIIEDNTKTTPGNRPLVPRFAKGTP